MPSDEGVVERLREVFEALPVAGEVVEKRMFGGIAFMVAGHMSCGVVDDDLMLRVGAEQHEEVLARPHSRPMDFTGKPLRGFVYVSPEGFEADDDLLEWVQLSLDFVATLPPKGL